MWRRRYAASNLSAVSQSDRVNKIVGAVIERMQERGHFIAELFGYVLWVMLRVFAIGKRHHDHSVAAQVRRGSQQESPGDRKSSVHSTPADLPGVARAKRLVEQNEVEFHIWRDGLKQVALHD